MTFGLKTEKRLALKDRVGKVEFWHSIILSLENYHILIYVAPCQASVHSQTFFFFFFKIITLLQTLLAGLTLSEDFRASPASLGNGSLLVLAGGKDGASNGKGSYSFELMESLDCGGVHFGETLHFSTCQAPSQALGT